MEASEITLFMVIGWYLIGFLTLLLWEYYILKSDITASCLFHAIIFGVLGVIAPIIILLIYLLGFLENFPSIIFIKRRR